LLSFQIIISSGANGVIIGISPQSVSKPLRISNSIFFVALLSLQIGIVCKASNDNVLGMFVAAFQSSVRSQRIPLYIFLELFNPPFLYVATPIRCEVFCKVIARWYNWWVKQGITCGLFKSPVATDKTLNATLFFDILVSSSC